MIKLLIFDLSGVVFSNEDEPFCKAFAQEIGVSSETFTKHYTHLLMQAERGEKTIEQLWKEMKVRFPQIHLSVEQLASRPLEYKEIFPDVLEVIDMLRSHYTLAYMTNYAQAYWDIIEGRYHITKHFDTGRVSFAVGERKPSPKGILQILRELDIPAEQALFTDDKKSNMLEIAKEGVHTIHFRSKDQFLNELSTLCSPLPFSSVFSHVSHSKLPPR